MFDQPEQILGYCLLGACLGLAYAAPHGLNMRLFDRDRLVLAMALFLLRLGIVGLSFIRVALRGWEATLMTILTFLLVLVVDFTRSWRRAGMHGDQSPVSGV